eukprot:9501908-Prorocentrum_lima.AAC.1
MKVKAFLSSEAHMAANVEAKFYRGVGSLQDIPLKHMRAILTEAAALPAELLHNITESKAAVPRLFLYGS